MFSVRLVTLDHYISRPIDNVYFYEDENNTKEWQEPVLRIFGSTPDGVKCCVHVHGVYPYLYVPYKGGESPERDALLLGAVLDEALKTSLTKRNFRFVHKVTLVSGIPLYGYHSKHRLFFKIYFYNPFHIRKASELLLSGTILGQKLQPHEAHIPYALQFMMDYNIYGMSFVTFSKIKYRRNPQNLGSLLKIKEEDIFSDKVKKMTWSPLEVDAWASDIMNRNRERVVGANPGLQAIWEEERLRRRVLGKTSQMTVQETESRSKMKLHATEIMYKERLIKKLEDISVWEQGQDVASETGELMHSYPVEVDDGSGILEVSALERVEHPQPSEEFLDVSCLIDEEVLTRLAESQRERTRGESGSEEDEAEADSVLGRSQKEGDEAELDEDEEGDDMTQPLDLDEDMTVYPDASRDEPGGSSSKSEDTFWKNMAERIFQLDGAHESSSESDADATTKSPAGGGEEGSGSQIPVDSGLSDLQSSSNVLRLSPTWSANILSFLSEDSVCPTPSTDCPNPQSFWHNDSPKMDSWLSQTQESWSWSKGGTAFVDYLLGKPQVETTLQGGTPNESTNDFPSVESYVGLSASNEEEYISPSSVGPFHAMGSFVASPPYDVLIPTSETNASNMNLDTIYESTKNILKPPLSSETNPVEFSETKETEKVSNSTFYKKLENDEEKLMNVLENFARGNFPSDNNRRLTFCLTLKQYIKDCKEIVSVDFKNLCNREMVIIEYKSLNKKSVQNKFLIKPLDKFLEKWNAAERKANERLSKGSDWPKVISGFNICGAEERESFRSLMNVLERKTCNPSKLKSLKKKLTVKSMEISRDDLIPLAGGNAKYYNINENVISQGKIRMKLIKSQSKKLDKNSIKDSGGTSKLGRTSSTSACAGRFYAKRKTVTRIEKGNNEEKKEKMRDLYSDECRRELRTNSRNGVLRKVNKWRNFSEPETKLINEINSSFEEYFKNVVKLKNISGKKKRSFPPRMKYKEMEEGSSEDENNEEQYLKNNSNTQAHGKEYIGEILSSSTVDSIKFVSRFLSRLSRTSDSRHLPPVSITISLGSTCTTAPVQMSLHPTGPVINETARFLSKRQRRKGKIENVDGPADGSSSDESGTFDPRHRSPKQKRTKRDAFYKPLNVVLHGTPSVSSHTRKKRKESSLMCAEEGKEESVKKGSCSRVSGDYFDDCRKNSSGLRVSRGEDQTHSKRPNSSEILVKYRTSNRSFRGGTSDVETGSGQSSSRLHACGDREPDFIYGSDKEGKFETVASRVGRRKPKMRRILEFRMIPQADTDIVTSSEDEDLEKNQGRILNNFQTGGPELAKDGRNSLVEGDPGSIDGEIVKGGLSGNDNTDSMTPHSANSLQLWPDSKDLVAYSNNSLSSTQTQNFAVLSGTPLFLSNKNSPHSKGSSLPSLRFPINFQNKLQKSDSSEEKIEFCSIIRFSCDSNSDSKSKDEENLPEFVENSSTCLKRALRRGTWRPKRKALSRNQVVERLALHDIVSCTEEPFFGDPRDVAKAMETGPRILKIGSHFVSGLKTFISTLEISGTEERRNHLLHLPKDSCENKRFRFVFNRVSRITPLRKPPSFNFMTEWLKIRKGYKNEEPKEKPKIKMVKPLSPGQEADSEEEMDLSVTFCSFLDDTVANKISGKCNISMESSSLGKGNYLDEEKMVENKIPLNMFDDSKRMSLLKKVDVVSRDTEFAVEDSHTLNSTKESKRSSENSFQIRGVTLENTLGFSRSVENVQKIKLSHTHQYLSLLVMELHVQTREDLRPDPSHDQIRALFYAINFDSPTQSQETGIIVVGEQLLSSVAVSKHTIHYVSTEKALFEKTISLVRTWDPDILAGYEIEMHSWGYLVQRGFMFEMNLLNLLGRVQGEESSSWNKEAKVPDERDEFDDLPRYIRHMKISGRIVLDFWRVLRHEVALTSYTFENVMYHLSQERHSLLSYRMLSFYWEHSSSKFRHITVEYYITRVVGVIKLLDQLDFINRTSELSRLFGIQFYEVLSRGSQFRVESMMLRLAKPLNFVAVSPSVSQRARMRAPASLPLILEPESFFYTDPLIVLDFQSLYPSIIIAYNYCFSTCLGRVENLGGRTPFEFGCTHLQISPEEVKRLKEEVTISPAGVAFVKSNVRKGVLPSMLEEILETRLMVKKSMKENKDNKTLQKVLYARQLGLKLIANVTYGYTAANFSGRMPCIEVGDSVVSKGRETLHRAIQLIKNTSKWGAKVVYGDTDSVFVLTPGRSREEAFRIGAEIAEAVTQDNPKPVKLKLEKVYHPSILQTKKRYVGYMYENPQQKKPVLEAKGIETVRRDGCPATGKILDKALRILFDTRDVSLVKKYTIRQFAKLFHGRVNIQDMIFAKEYRGRRGYRPGACVPALYLARQWTHEDKRAEPRVKERVPYVIVNGPPGVPLIRLVRAPTELLIDPSLRINAVYYITKAIIPPMQRCFSLLGADVTSWYSEMPRKYHKAYNPGCGDGRKKSTISQYFATAECIACSKVTNAPVCQECEWHPQILVLSCMEKIRRLERCHSGISKICQTCCGRETELDCRSVDCPVLFRRNQALRDLQQGPALREILARYL